MFNSKDNNLLYEAYASVYNSAEYLEESQHARENPEKYEDDERRKMSKKQRAMNDPKTGINSPAFATFMAQQMGGKKKKKDVKEDVYQIILSYLLDEGYADDAHSAVAIMGNMSEEWRQSIVEAEVLAAKGGVPGTMKVKPTQQGGFLGIGARTVNKPVPGSFTPKDVSSKDAARFNNRLDRKFGETGNIDATPAANIQHAANRAGHSGYMKVKDTSSIPNTGIPNRPTPGRAADQNQARTMGSDIVRMNRR